MGKDKSSRQPHETAPQDRVPFGQKAAYGSGAYADNYMQNGINVMANPVFNMTLGVAPELISTALALPRLWDAIVDPVVGSMSDNARTRWGRRKPFLVVGAIMCGILFSVVWMVPHGWSEWGYFAHFLIMSVVFFTAYAVYAMPFGALGFEMSPDYHERTRVMAFRNFFSSVAGVSMAWMFWLANRSVFSDTLDGMRWVGSGVGVMMIILALVPVFFVKERAQPNVARQPKIPLVRSLKESLSIKPFRLILYAVVLMSIGLFMVNSLGSYINIYYVYGGDLRAASAVQGWAGTAYHISSLVALPLITLASTHFGKRRTLAFCLCMPLVGTLLKWVCYTPDYPYLQLIPVALMGPGMASFWTLLGSMVADVCDVDELKNGVRREGTLNAVYTWAFKLGLSIALLLSGFVLSFAGFNAGLGGAQTDSAILTMRLLFTFTPAVALAFTIWIVWRFPIGEKQAYEIRGKLEEARAKNTPAP